MNPANLNVKHIYLIDAGGALVSAGLLGIVLVNLDAYFTMPKYILQILSIAACALALHSLLSFFIVKNKKRYLIFLAIANYIYCFVTVVLIVLFYASITIWDLCYFIGELIIVLYLSKIEWKASLLIER